MLFQYSRSSSEPEVLALRKRSFSCPRMLQMTQSRVRVGPSDPVRRKPEVHLELAKGIFGMGTEHPIFAAHQKSEGSESLLELFYIMTSEIRHTQVERTISQIVRGIH